MDQLFFDQYDTQVGVIGVLAGPAGLRATGWRLDAHGASIEPDETVQQTIGQLREYFAGQRRSFELTLDLPPLPSSTEAVLRALMTVGYGETITYGNWPSGAVRAFPPGRSVRSWPPIPYLS
jgi:methylated-DNA-[protein]-cysteine S-methyltransferase